MTSRNREEDSQQLYRINLIHVRDLRGMKSAPSKDMITQLMILIELISFIASAHDPIDFPFEEKAPCRQRLDPRFVMPKMSRRIDVNETEKVFQALTRKQLQNGTQLYTQNIKVAPLLAEEFGIQDSRVAVELIAYNWPGTADSPWLYTNHLDRSVGATLMLRLPNNSERGFAERLISRRTLIQQLRSAAQKIGAAGAISDRAIPNSWGVSTEGRGSEIIISLNNFTHAEFDTVLNTIARQLYVLAR
jgi:hypothetical protein